MIFEERLNNWLDFVSIARYHSNMLLTPKQLENIGKIFINLGTLSFGALVIGKFVSVIIIPWYVFLAGLLFSITMFFWAIIIDKGEIK
ncbi:MAG: hypothetical protein KAU38_16565 [Desulfobacterales bacterium]|nr:hypothetical protein [Desulfobacterales bacterium]